MQREGGFVKEGIKKKREKKKCTEAKAAQTENHVTVCRWFVCRTQKKTQDREEVEG